MQKQPTTTSANVPVALTWLRARLLPTGHGSLMFAAYAMLMAALVTFVLFQRDLAPRSFILGLLALATMFVLHVVMPDLDTHLGKERSVPLHLLANGALWLLVSGIALESNNLNFSPFLMYMLVAQAAAELKPRTAVAYTGAILGGWLVLLWQHDLSLEMMVANLLTISTGLVFVGTFSYVLKLYRAQTERAEALLAQLREANVALEGARRREQELAVAQERVRLARDIHDGLGHHLTALNVQLQAAARLIERDPARAAVAITTSREVAQAALDEVRQSVAAMRRSPLDGQSLPEALTTLVGDFARRAALDAAFHPAGEPVTLSPAAAQTLYRAAQEGLTNAQRHGAAQHVSVTLTYSPESARLTVSDDGAGANESSGGGFGLAGLRERAEQLGGTFYAGPCPEGGYSLTIAVPVEPKTL